MALAGIVAGGGARAGSDVYVLQDGTPLVSKPGVGGKILLWVDTGFPLRVVGREGDWLKVSGAGLKVGGAFWVPAARVGRHLPGTFDIAYSQEGPSAGPGIAPLFLEVVGTPDIRVRARCRIVQPGKDDFIDVIDRTPLQLDVSGIAADCTVRKLGDRGTAQVVLRTAAGEVIAESSTFSHEGAVRVRTDGPWGRASGIVLPARFVFLKRRPNFPLPAGSTVLPLGNPTPTLGNPTPALGNPVPPFQQSPVP